MFYRLRRRLQALFPRVNIELVYTHDLTDIPDVQSKIPIRIDLLNKNTINRINEVKRLNTERLIRRLKRGDHCYVAIPIETENLASYHWVQYNGRHFIQQAGKNVEIEDDEACIFHVRVADQYRGNRINGCVYRKILMDAKKENLKKIWIYTNFYNHPNRKGLEKLGFVKESKFYSLRIDRKYYQLFEKTFDV